MHSTTCAILPHASVAMEQRLEALIQSNKSAVLDYFADKLEKPLERFYVNLAKPRRVYLNQQEVTRMQARYPGADLDTLATKISDWESGQGGIDENGLYYDTFKNEEGQYDYWSAYDIMPIGEYLMNLDSIGVYPQAILLPDMTFIEHETGFFGVNKNNAAPFGAWMDRVKDLLSRYPHALVIFLDFHI